MFRITYTQDLRTVDIICTTLTICSCVSVNVCVCVFEYIYFMKQEVKTESYVHPSVDGSRVKFRPANQTRVQRVTKI